MKTDQKQAGVTLLEVVVVIALVAILIVVAVPTYRKIKDSAGAAVSSRHLRALVAANEAYAAEHNMTYCPATSKNNKVRWHGSRESRRGAFSPEGGFLSPYLQNSTNVVSCPLFKDVITGSSSFEEGAGAFGYNWTYIGGLPQDHFQGNRTFNVPDKANTIMFTSTALAKSKGLQEYPFCEPYEWVDPNWILSGQLQPSVHFRYGGKALVAWCDGHVTLEEPAEIGGPNYYGGDNKESMIGWLGPKEENGYWNPRYRELTAEDESEAAQ